MDLLLVEDDIDLQKVLAQYLELSGFRVYSANHGEHGLKIFKEIHVFLFKDFQSMFSVIRRRIPSRLYRVVVSFSVVAAPSPDPVELAG